MSLTPTQLHQIPLTHLHPHPLHPQRISPANLHKLRSHIQRSGFHEPLLVRPHPSIPDHYQLLHGHHRLLALAALHQPDATCIITNLSDADSLLVLATINSLSGKEIATKRLVLLETLAVCHAQVVCHAQGSGPLSMPPTIDHPIVKLLSTLLPESERTLTAMLASHHHPPPASAPSKEDLPEAFTLFLPSKDKHRLLQALKTIHPDKSQALLHLLNQS